MSNIISFKARAAQIVSTLAYDFKSNFVDFEYLVCSEAFSNAPYYIVSANEDNYMHLTGIPYNNPRLFFEKCLNGSFAENDIQLIKYGQSENEVKGSIRRKIKVLPNLINIFSVPLLAEESFSKNKVICSFGTSDGICTVGFTLTSKSSQIVKPMTLLSGFELDESKAKPVDLILKRKSGNLSFDTLVYGNKEMIDKYHSKIVSIISNQLL